MKRFALALLCVLGVAASAGDALAYWKLQPVKWTHPGTTPHSDFTVVAGLRGWARDTLTIPMAAAKVDTSAEFSLLDCDMPTPIDYGRTATTGDSTAFAFVCLVADSGVASSVNWKNTTVALQVNYGDGAGWQTGLSWATLPTDGQKVNILPIWSSLSALTNDLPVDLTSPLGLVAPRARIIVTGGTAVAAPQTRIYVKKFYRNVTIDKGAFSTQLP